MNLNICRWVQARLPLLAGDDLVGPDRRLTERHLVGCPDCRRQLTALRGVLQTLHAAADIPAIAADTPSLWPDLARQIRESRLAPAWHRWPRLLASPIAALAATLLLTLGTAAAWSRLQPDEPATREDFAVTAPVPRGALVLEDSDLAGDRSDDEILATGTATPVDRRLDGDQLSESRNTH